MIMSSTENGLIATETDVFHSCRILVASLQVFEYVGTWEAIMLNCLEWNDYSMWQQSHSLTWHFGWSRSVESMLSQLTWCVRIWDVQLHREMRLLCQSTDLTHHPGGIGKPQTSLQNGIVKKLVISVRITHLESKLLCIYDVSCLASLYIDQEQWSWSLEATCSDLLSSTSITTGWNFLYRLMFIPQTDLEFLSRCGWCSCLNLQFIHSFGMAS